MNVPSKTKFSHKIGNNFFERLLEFFTKLDRVFNVVKEYIRIILLEYTKNKFIENSFYIDLINYL